MSNQAGKGSKTRPVDIKKYNENHDQIDWSAHKKIKTVSDDERMKIAAEMSKI